MKKVTLTLAFILLYFFLTPSNALAIFDPLSVPNNKFGIHISSENDLKDAARLVNSNGGDWGYVTFVITENERNTERWQRAFDEARRLHLIPLVRIASKPEGDTWAIPEESEIDNWVNFLDSLNWVIKNRYVIIGNEPNHTLEWGGKINPGEYSDYLINFSKSLKARNSDFFILPAGLDAAANQSRTTIPERRFIDLMIKKNPDVFNYIDGWTSHSYPSTGINTYVSEIRYLKSKGFQKDLPIFITETGWQLNKKNTNENQISEYYVNAFSNEWKDKSIVAITPFILDYTAPPFDKFSWKKADGTYYSFYNTVSQIQKIKGEPTQDMSGSILAVFLPSFDFSNTEVSGTILAKNTGQSIWDTKNTGILASGKGFSISDTTFEEIEPYKVGFIYFKGETPGNPGWYKLFIGLTNNGNIISNIYTINLTNISLPQVQKASFFGKIGSFLGL